VICWKLQSYPSDKGESIDIRGIKVTPEEEHEILVFMLERLITTISEERYCAQWYWRIEYILWGEVLAYRKDPKGLEYDADARAMDYLSQKIDGWIHSPESLSKIELVSTKEWLKIYEEKS
jgi:hypothetical protein